MSLDDTKTVADDVYHILARQPEVASVDESIGDNGSLNVADLYITLVPRNKRSASQQDWQNRVLGLLKAVPDARMNFQTQNGDSDGHAITDRPDRR